MSFTKAQDLINVIRLNLRTAVPTPILGLDLGSRYVGLAVSDDKALKSYVLTIKDLFNFAKGLGNFKTTQRSILDDDVFHEYILKVTKRNKITGIIIGYPEGNDVRNYSLSNFFK